MVGKITSQEKEKIMELIFRNAIAADLKAITEIYNDAILNTTATFDTEIKTIENREEWLSGRNENFPVLVVLHKDTIVGYSSLNKWSDKKAYNITAELSIYIHPAFRGKGIGKLLFKELLLNAQQTTLVSLVSRITEGNEQSITLHKQEGFKEVGILKQCGEKFGKLLDVMIMQKMLRD